MKNKNKIDEMCQLCKNNCKIISNSDGKIAFCPKYKKKKVKNE